MAEKSTIRYTIDSEVSEKFTKKAEELGIIPSKFVEGCMKAYVASEFKWADGKPLFAEQEYPLLPRVAEDTSRGKPGPKPKNPPPEDSKGQEATPLPLKKSEELISDPAQAIRLLTSSEGLDPSRRKLISYSYVKYPAGRDDTPHLKMNTHDGKGGTFKDLFEKEWLPFRLITGEDYDQWVHRGLEIGPLNTFTSCCANKFSEDNGLKYRYHQDELWGEIIILDQQLHMKYKKEIEDAIPEMREEA